MVISSTSLKIMVLETGKMKIRLKNNFLFNIVYAGICQRFKWFFFRYVNKYFYSKLLVNIFTMSLCFINIPKVGVKVFIKVQ